MTPSKRGRAISRHLHTCLALLLTLSACEGMISEVEEIPDLNDPTNVEIPLTETEECAPLPKRVRRLAPVQYDRTIGAILPDLGYQPSSNFVDTHQVTTRYLGGVGALGMTTPHVGDVLDEVESLSALVVEAMGGWVDCLLDGSDMACDEEALEELLRRSFRRPATAEELTRFGDFYRAQLEAFDAQDAWRMVVEAILMSPHTLYRTEIGDVDSDEMNLFEIASAISYAITDGPPDETLWQAAEDGSLADTDVRVAQAERLLSTSISAEGVRRFLREHMRADALHETLHNLEEFPELTDGLRDAMSEEFDLYTDHVFWEDEGTFLRALTAPYTFLNGTLADHYEIEGPRGEEFERIQTEGRRTGLLNLGAYLLQSTHEDSTSVVLRGVSILEDLLCRDLPAPPPDVDDQLPVVLDGRPTTQRERLEAHRSVGTCNACHARIDPAGYAFEQFDALGRERTHEQGLPIDTSGVVRLDDEDYMVSNVHEFVNRLGASEQAQTCFARHVMLFIDGQARGTECISQRTDASLREIVQEMVSGDQFVSRVNPEVGP